MGEPQGSILRPTYFPVYINDVALATGDSLIHLYADDPILYTSGSSLDTVLISCGPVGHLRLISKTSGEIAERQIQINYYKYSTFMKSQVQYIKIKLNLLLIQPPCQISKRIYGESKPCDYLRTAPSTQMHNKSFSTRELRHESQK